LAALPLRWIAEVKGDYNGEGYLNAMEVFGKLRTITVPMWRRLAAGRLIDKGAEGVQPGCLSAMPGEVLMPARDRSEGARLRMKR